jgi:hypothetical protein
MSDQNKKKSVAYGQLAEEYRDAIIKDSVQHLTRPASPEEKHREESQKQGPSILSDPQGTIIRSRLQRFKPAITHYAKNLCMRHISQDDFLISVRNESQKLLENIQSMGRLMLSSGQVRDKVNEVVDTLHKMMEGIPRGHMDIQMVPPIVDKTMEIIETAIATRAAMPEREKHQEIRERAAQRYPSPENDPLADFPPEIRQAIVERLTMIGLNPRDIDTIKRLARQFGVEDPDAAIEQLKRGEIPEELKNFF